MSLRGSKPVLSKDQRGTIKELRENGVPVDQLASTYGVHPQTIRNAQYRNYAHDAETDDDD